jgi:hypothetical protein
MASRLPGAVDQLRRHFRGMTDDGDDIQQADQYLLDVINSLHDNGEGEGEEEEGAKDRVRRSRDASAPEKYWGGKAMDGRMGLDRALQGDRRPCRPMSDGALKKILDGVVQPKRAGAVR